MVSFGTDDSRYLRAQESDLLCLGHVDDECLPTEALSSYSVLDSNEHSKLFGSSADPWSGSVRESTRMRFRCLLFDSTCGQRD